jgi:hypothetical protein
MPVQEGHLVRKLIGISILTVTLGACGSMTRPSPSIDLSGTWSGVVGSGSGGGRALRLTWTATQTGNTVSGPATIATSPSVSDLTFPGTLTGLLTGTQLSLTYSAASGSIAAAPQCSVSARGTAASTSTAISGQFDVTFLACDLLGLQAPASDQFTLTKP